MRYSYCMSKRKSNPIKAEIVKAKRGYTPDEIVDGGERLDVRQSPKNADQLFEIYLFENYVWVVVTGKNPPRLITAYKSRKFKKEYGI